MNKLKCLHYMLMMETYLTHGTNSLESKVILEHVLHSSCCGQEGEVANVTFLRRCVWNRDTLRGETDKLYERQAPGGPGLDV